MGLHSWEYCDRPGRLKVGGSGYLLCPAGEPIRVSYYDGYSHMGGYDVFELVVDWNHAYMKRIVALLREGGENPHRCSWYHLDILDMFVSSFFDEDETDRYVDGIYGKDYVSDWKRDLGIWLSCYDEDNAKLDYPIKIASAPVPYDSVPPSLSDPLQGCD